jgi:uncharacterized hydrophobic protein (TIGR00271 family)
MKMTQNAHTSYQQEARAEIARNARFDRAFIVMNALASVIASYALLADSTSGVIGAMLIAMLLGPIAGLSLSLVDGDYPLLRQSLSSLVGGISVVVLCALIIGFIHADIPAGKELLGRTHPNYLDMMIALGGGAVGAYAAMTPRISNAVVGVAISTALVPPLCTGAIFTARGEWDNALGGYLLSFANIVAIQFASSLTLWLAGLHRVVDQLYRNPKITWLNGISLAMVVGLFLALGASTQALLSKARYEKNTRNALIEEMRRFPGASVSDVSIDREAGKILVRAVVQSPYGFTFAEIGDFESKLPAPPDGSPIELRLRHIKISVMTREGFKYDEKLNQLETPE